MGKSQSVISGYRYSLGMLMGISKGPVDRLRALRVADRMAWSIDDGSTRDLRSAGLDPLGALALGLQVDGAGNIGAGAMVPEELGTFAGVAATAAVGDADFATITFSGTTPGALLGRSYDIALGTDATTVKVIIDHIAFSGDADVTTWFVTPASTAFAAQSVQIQTTVLAPPPAERESGAYGGQIRIDRPDLLGGDQREGGVVGDIDVQMGRADQGQNDYLVAQLGADRVLGYRGLLTLVLRQVYLAANNYYIKPWAALVEHITEPADGSDDWYPEKARIWVGATGHGSTFTLQADTHAGADDAAGIAAGVTVSGLDADAEYRVALVSGAWSPWGSPALTDDNSGAITAFRVVRGTDAATVVHGGSSTRQDGYAAAADAYTPCWITGSDTYTFYLVDDPVADNAGSMTLRLEQVDTGPEMNPAHVVRIISMTRRDGKRLAASDIDDDALTAAANTLYAEGLGIGFLWDGSGPDGVLGEVLSTIDGAWYRSLTTGKWTLKLIRGDYDIGDLPVLDDSNVVDWGKFAQGDPGQLVNRVTVTYRDARTDDRTTVQATDLGGYQAMGEIVEAAVSYEMIGHRDLAARLAERDLRALGAPLLRADGITVFRSIAWDLSPGAAVVLNSARMGLSNVVVRVLEVGRGDIGTSTVRLSVAEDVFATPSAPVIGATAPDPDPTPSGLPLPPTRRLAVEAPYWTVVQELGHLDADAQLADDPDAGWVLAGAGLPAAGSVAAEVWTRPGTTYAREAEIAFSPSALLDGAVTASPLETALAVTGLSLSRQITIGTLASIGDEIVVIRGVAADALSVGRGALDTVPQAHADGTPVIVWPNTGRMGATRRAAGEEIDVAILTRTVAGTMPLAAATPDAVTMDSRAIRPLPPRQVQIDSSYAPDADALKSGPVTVTWAHRNRLAETGAVLGSFTAAGVTSEPGVTYEVRVHWVHPGTGARVDPAAVAFDAGTATSQAISPGDVPWLSAPSGTEQIEVSVVALRTVGGTEYESLQAYAYRLTVPDGLAVAQAELWVEYGQPADALTAAQAELWVEYGQPAHALTVAQAELWIEEEI